MRKHEIEQLIRSLGIGATYRGYHYLVYGVSLCMDNEDYLLSVGKLLYTRIAEAYSTTGSSVERDSDPHLLGTREPPPSSGNCHVSTACPSNRWRIFRYTSQLP